MKYTKEELKLTSKLKEELTEYVLTFEEKWAEETDNSNLIESYIALKRKVMDFESDDMRNLLDDVIDTIEYNDYGDLRESLFESPEDREEWRDNEGRSIKDILEKKLEVKRLGVLK